MELETPLALSPAIKLGVIFALVLAIAKLAQIYLDTHGIILVSILSGLVNLDAITISLSQLATESITLYTAEKGIILAIIANTAVKGGIAHIVGNRKFKKAVMAYSLSIILAGLLMLVVL